MDPKISPSAPPQSPGTDAPKSTNKGYFYIAGAASIWGFFPLVFQWVSHLPALEILALRSLWTLFFVIILLFLIGRREFLYRAFYTRPALIMGAAASVAIAINWGVFIWAVSNGQVLQSSLGYYISPLISVLLGVVVLHEHLRPLAWTAIGVVSVGVGVLVIGANEWPWAALAIALSWGLYGLIRKVSPLGPLAGLFLETLLLSPLFAAYLIYLGPDSQIFNQGYGIDFVVIIVIGFLTALTLLSFSSAARLLPLSTIGVMMYSVPSAQFLLAVFYFKEAFSLIHLGAFSIIWLGLFLYAWDSLRRR